MRLFARDYTVYKVTPTDALADFQDLTSSTSKHAPGGSHIQFGELLWSDSRASDPFLNAVTPLASVRNPSTAAIQHALQACADTRSPFSWWFHEHLPPEAATAGFEAVESTALMSLVTPDDSQLPAVNGLVTPGYDLAEFFTTASLGFEDNNTEFSSLVRVFEPLVKAGTVVPLVVRDAGLVVGTLLLHLGRENLSRAGIYWVSTLPASRGNGIASALVKYAIQYASAMQRTHVVLQSSQMAEHIYRQLGFSLQGRMGIAKRVTV